MSAEVQHLIKVLGEAAAINDKLAEAYRKIGWEVSADAAQDAATDYRLKADTLQL